MNTSAFHYFLLVFTMFIQSKVVDCLNVTTSPDGLIIFIGTLPLINHNIRDPVLAVGSSRANFTESLGNFIIDDLVEEKINLPDFLAELDGLPQNLSVVFFNKNHPNLSIEMNITDGKVSQGFQTAVRVDIRQTSGHQNRIWFRLQSNKTEKIYGGGEQFTYLNLKGREFPIWTREQGVGRNRSDPLTDIVEVGSPGAGGDYHTTYYPIPIFLSNLNYVVQCQNKGYSVMNFSYPEKNEIYVHGQQLNIDFATAENMRELVGGINHLAAPEPPSFPEWIYNGAIVAVQGGTQKMLERIQQCLDAGVHISAVWIQDWSGKIQTSFGYRVFWNWRWNQELYPELDQVIKDLSLMRIQVTAYINPYLNSEGDLFHEADELGYLLKDKQNQTLKEDFGEFLAGTIDILNPRAKQWYTDLIQNNLIDLGFKGFMADFGEYTSLVSVPSPNFGSDRFDPYEFHNEMPVLWASTIRSALDQSGMRNEILPWARSGFTGAQQYHSIVWAGDQNVDWSRSDGLPSSIVAALSMGMSGFGLSHSDIGGYTTIDLILTRSEELLLRWAEYSVFTPMMRTHEGNKPNLNHQITSTNATLERFGRLTRIYTRLKNYHKNVIEELSIMGLPAMRPLFLHYPNDEETFNIQYQFLYGTDLLVAPVLEPNKTNWTVFLPSDEWIHVWDVDKVSVNGPQTVVVNAPLGQPPVFYRSYSKWKALFESLSNI